MIKGILTFNSKLRLNIKIMKKIILTILSSLFLFCSYKNPGEASYYPVLIFNDYSELSGRSYLI